MNGLGQATDLPETIWPSLRPRAAMFPAWDPLGVRSRGGAARRFTVDSVMMDGLGDCSCAGLHGADILEEYAGVGAICTTAMGAEAKARVSLFREFWNRVKVDPRAARFEPAAASLLASWDKTYGLGIGAMLPFWPTNCALADIADAATALMAQISAEIGVNTPRPVPAAASKSGQYALIVLAGLTVAVAAPYVVKKIYKRGRR